MQMTVTEMAGSAVELGLSGRLDTAGVDAIETRFNAASIAADRHALVNLADVEFVSSMGVRMLLMAAKAQKARHRRFLLMVPPGSVREMLETAAIDTLIPMFETRDEALVHLTR
ncbi:MAG: STAS domain-containing protein [Rubrivivax sp.]|nr:STAS domain-containing protein [Rubrivivax sp.]